MEPIRFVVTAVRIFLTLGLMFGYGAIVRDMASAAFKANTQKPFSAAKFNRLLWSKELKKKQPANPWKGVNK